MVGCLSRFCRGSRYGAGAPREAEGAAAQPQAPAGENGEPLEEFEEDPAADGLRIVCVPAKTLTGPEPEIAVLVSVRTPSGGQRNPADIACVVDISGSMGNEARIQDASGHTESHGLSLLDIAKHGVRTIIQMLNAKDRLSITAFNNEARAVLPLTAMDEEGRLKAQEELDCLMHGGGTDIWKGLHLGLENLRRGQRPGESFAHVLLLTDGESLERDKIVPNLQAYKQNHEALPGTVNTFGFGYNIDSRLLVNLAKMGNGSYSFIPDAGFVGTAFVNTLGNLLVTMATDAYLSLEAEGDSSIHWVLGDRQVDEASWGVTVALGNLQYGQSKDVVVIMSIDDPKSYITANGSFALLGGGAPATFEAVQGGELGKVSLVEPAQLRSRYVDVVSSCLDEVRVTTGGYQSPIRSQTKQFSVSPKESYVSHQSTDPASPTASRTSKGSLWQQGTRSVRSMMRVSKKNSVSSNSTVTLQTSSYPVRLDPETVNKSLKSAQETMMHFVKELETSPCRGMPEVKALLEDTTGQTHQAFSCAEYYCKWGRHYMPSIMFAHALQQCNNFKDPGVQFYGGELFTKVRDEADEIFNNLPAPMPKVATTYSGRAYTAPVSMAAYNDRYAGCIDGESPAMLASGEIRKVRELRKGDAVRGPGGATAEVVCKVRSPCPGGRAPLARLPGGLRLTPHHPVNLDGAWVFPADVAIVEEQLCDAVYTFVLAGAPALLVGGVPCVSLGHGIEEGAAAHPFFGSRRAIEDLARCPGFAEGRVELLPGSALRDPETGLVCGLLASSARPCCGEGAGEEEPEPPARAAGDLPPRPRR